MAGGRQNRRVSSIYQRTRPVDTTTDEDLSMPSQRRRRRSSTGRRRRSQEEQLPLPQEEDERVEDEEERVEDEEDERVEDEEDEREEDEDGEEEEEVEEEAAAGSASSGTPSVYLRGPASLPTRPIPSYRRPKIAPDGET